MRKPKKYHFIYKTTNIINDKFYIGMHSTDNLNDNYIGSGKILWYSVKKYGRDNFKFEILEFLPDRKSLKNREMEIVNENMLSNQKCMNIKKGGDGGFTLEQTKNGRKITNQILLEKHGEYFYSVISKNYHDFLTPEQKIEFINKIKKGQINYNHITFLGKNHTEESKRKIGEKNKRNTGEKNSQYNTMWIYNLNENKKIKKDEWDYFCEMGWKKGRKILGQLTQ